MSDTDRAIVFWGQEEDAYLAHTEKDVAIEEILDGMDDINNLPETIEVCGFTRREPSVKHEASYVLESLLERLDDEYGNPDGGCTEATESMKAAAETFATAVLDEFTSWSCDIVKRETVNVREWIKKNRPDWLGEGESCES